MAEATFMSEEKTADKTIDDWRIRIDEIDLELVRLFNERTNCAIEIGHIKKRLGLDIYSPSRESQVIANVTVPSNACSSASLTKRAASNAFTPSNKRHAKLTRRQKLKTL
jgi:chorismate mutase